MRSEVSKAANVQFDTLCFGGEDWWYHNRAHIDMQLMRRFAGRGTVIYVNSLVVAKPSWKEGNTFLRKVVRKTRSICKGLQRSDAGFWVYSPFSLPVHHIRWLRRVNYGLLRLQLHRVCRKLGMAAPLVWVACPAACDAALAMKRSRLVYQRTDRFEEFPNVCRDTVQGYDQRLKAAADVTVFVSRALFEQEREACRKAVFLDHGVDFELFASAEKDARRPADLAGVPKPIVGFFGGFAEHTTDVSLLQAVVRRLSRLSFVFVGKPSKESEVLQGYPNVRMLGQRAYEEIPHYGKCFDVAIMPWKQNEWIRVCNPVKLKEYLALGKPVVSTPFAQLADYRDVVYEADTSDSFADAIERALAEDDPMKVAARRARVQGSTWDQKAQAVLKELYPA